MQGVVKSETDRKATAERIVLSLELANLKRAIDRGNGFASELSDARKLSGGSVDLTPLAALRRPGRADARRAAEGLQDDRLQDDRRRRRARATAPCINRLLAGAKSVVHVRKVSQIAGDVSVEAVVARMEAALNEDRLGDVLAEAKTLPPRVQDVARDFLAKVEARYAVDGALSTVEAQLKASLVAPATAPTKSQE